MRKTALQILLSELKPVPSPSPDLEQYQTPSRIAAELLHQARLANDLDGTVMDLGTGNGILAIGAALLGADHVYAYDIDPDSLAIAEDNKQYVADAKRVELPVTFIEQDVLTVDRSVDTVVMNPPFGLQRGTRNRNTQFLKTAFESADTVYALLHRSEEKTQETRDHLTGLAADHGFETTVLAGFDFPLPRAYSFHQRERMHIKVDLYKFVQPV